MDVFVTGGTGYIGEAVVRELVAAGHTVTALARSDEKEAALRALGALPVRGDLGEPGSYQTAAVSADALVHAAFEYSSRAVEKDRAAVETLLGAAAQSSGDCVVVYTSGVWVLGDTGETPADEDAPLRPAPLVAWRPPHEERVLAAASDRVAAAVIRPAMVFGGSGGLVGDYFRTAEEEGAARLVGDGANRLSLIHVEDLARHYRRVVETRGRGVFHVADGRFPRLREVAEAASRAAGAGGRVASLTLEEGRAKLGPMADALVLDQAVVTRRAGELGWEPRRRGFVDDVDAVYREWRAARHG